MRQNKCADINASQLLVEIEYKEDFHSQPIIAELTQHDWELGMRKRMKQHIANHIKGITTNAQFDWEIKISLSETILPDIWKYYFSTRSTKPQASTVLKSLGRIS